MGTTSASFWRSRPPGALQSAATPEAAGSESRKASTWAAGQNQQQQVRAKVQAAACPSARAPSSADEWRSMLYHTPVASRSVFSSAVMLTSTARRCSSALLQTRRHTAAMDGRLSFPTTSTHAAAAATKKCNPQSGCRACTSIYEHMRTGALSVPLSPDGLQVCLHALPVALQPLRQLADVVQVGHAAWEGQGQRRQQTRFKGQERDTGCHSTSHRPSRLATSSPHGMA